MGWKKIALLGIMVYSFFTCALLNIFGMQLAHQQQYYQWGILNLPAARYQLFKSAIIHFIMFLSTLILYHYRYSENLNKQGFIPLHQDNNSEPNLAFQSRKIHQNGLF